MSQVRKTSNRVKAVSGPEARAHAQTARKPLSARSVIASTLLGIEPPRLPVQLLVRSGEAFGISEGTTRTAVSRMLAAGELVVDGDGYRLAGDLLSRQQRQKAGRAAQQRHDDGRWAMAVVTADRRTAPARAELRAALGVLQLGELREGVWLRPNNLPDDRAPGQRAVVNEQCRWFLIDEPDDARDLVGRLWDLEAWSAHAVRLGHEMRSVMPRLEAGDLDALAPGFVLSADVLRHLVADPLLPAELLPTGWPGLALRRDYDPYDAAFKALWRDWFKQQS